MKYLSIQTFQCGISVSGLATFTGGAEINILSLNGATTSSEASLFLGAHSSLEGGQLVLQKGTGQTYAAHLDNYSDQFRVLFGTNTGSAGVAMSINLATRQLTLPTYTSTSSFPGTVAGYLAFDSVGNIITTSLALSGYVPTSRTLTINGTSYDLSADRTWTINTVDYTSRLQHQVKAGVAINKGQAVYVTSADGTNMIVGLASNASEATSSKTMGLLDATVSTNGFANVVTEGLLAGLDTTAAGAEGDPVWLGTGGNLIYGLANKPYAPAHLVFIGIVTRKNANNGEIFVKVQNGFELDELHNVDLKTVVPVNGQILGFDGTLWVNKTIAGWLGYTPVSGTGTTNYLPKFTGSTSLGDSKFFDNGTTPSIYVNSLNATSRFYFSPVHADGRINLNAVAGTNDYTLLRAWHTGNTVGIGNGSTFGSALSTYYDSVLIGTSGAIYFMNGTFGPNNVPYRLGISTSATTTYFTSGVENNTTNLESNEFIYTAKAHTFRTGTTTGNQSQPNQYTPLFLSTAGNVGIGTTGLVPGYLLTINGGVSITAGQSLSLDPSAGIYMVASSSQFRLYNNSIAALSVASTGNVLVNTTTDSGYKLDINGTARINSSLYITDPSYTGSGRLFQNGNNTLTLTGGPGGGTENITFGPSNRIFINASQTRVSSLLQTAGGLSVGTFGYPSSYGAQAYISGSTTANAGAGRGLYIDSTIVAAANNDVLVGLDINPTFTNGAFTGVGNFSLRAYGYSNFQSGINIYPGNPVINSSGIPIQGALFTWGGGDTVNYYAGYQSGSGFYHKFWTNSTERVRISDGYTSIVSGNLLVGTTTDGGYKLDVNGITRLQGTTLINSQLNISAGPTYASTQLRATTGNTLEIRSNDASVLSTTFFQNGNVLIGTGSDSGYKLDVVGTTRIKANSLTVSASGLSSPPANYLGINFDDNPNHHEYWFAIKSKKDLYAPIGTGYDKIIFPTMGNDNSTWQFNALGSYSRIQISATNNTAGNYLDLTNSSIGFSGPWTVASIDRTNRKLVFGNMSTDVHHIAVYDIVIKGAQPFENNYGVPNGGNIYIVGGTPSTTPSGNYGNVILAHDGTALRGLVGIGTNSPSQLLHVAGNLRLTGAFYDSNNQAGTAGQILKSTGTGTDWVSLSEITGVDGTGTANYLAKWSDADTVTNSLIYDNGTNVGIGTTSPSYPLDVRSSTQNTTLQILNAGNAGQGTSTASLIFGNADSYTSTFTLSNSGITLATHGGSSPFNVIGTLAVGSISGAKLAVKGDGATSATKSLYIANSDNSRTLSYTDDGKLTLSNGTYTTKWYIGSGYNPTLEFSTRGEITWGNGAIFRFYSTGDTTDYRLENGTFYTNNSQARFYAGGSGYLGFQTIGTTTPYDAIGAVFTDNNTVSLRFFYKNTGSDIEGMRLTSSGNFLIGTTTDSGYKLDVNGTARIKGNVDITTSGGTNVLLAYSSYVQAWQSFYVSQGGGAHNFAVSNASSGGNAYFNNVNVGIGTTAPSKKLHIYESGAKDAELLITSTYADGYDAQITLENTHTGGRIYELLSTNDSRGIIGGGKFVINDKTAGDSVARLVIDTSGNVGIGTTAPAQQLHVTQNIALGLTGGSIGDTNNILFPTVNGTHTYAPNGIFYTKKGNWGGQIDIRTSYDWGYATDNAKISLNGAEGNGIVFYTGASALGSTERVRITSDGNVGIGTTSPAAALHTVGTGIVNIVQSSNSVSYTQYYNSSTGTGGTNDGLTVGNNGVDAYIWQRESADLLLGTSNTEALRITSTQKVGIGTSSPDSKLHIEGTTTGTGSGADAIVHIKQNGGWNGNEPWALYVEGYSYLNGFRINAADGQRGLYSDAGQLGFAVSGNSPISFTQNTSDYRMYIASGGNIGIGTTSPSEKLEVVGAIKAGIAGNSSANTPALRVTSAGQATTQAAIAIQQTYTEGDTIIFADYDQYVEWNFMHENAANQFIIHGGTSTNGLNTNTFYSPNGTAKTGYIKHVFDQTNGDFYVGGNVGIGTTSPATKLDVSGVITATGGNSTNWNTAYGWGNHSSAGYVPQTRTLTINGTSYDLSANRSWTIATTTPGGSDTQFQYNSSGSLAGASALTYNSANNRIGVNQASPGYDFDVNGQVRVQDKLRVGTVNSGNGVVHMSSSATINPNTTTIVWAQNVSVGMCAFIEYYILNNNSLTDQRAGTIMVTWNQSGTPTIAHTETTTPDIGSTTAVNFTSTLVGSDARINAVNSSANPYTIVMSYKYF